LEFERYLDDNGVTNSDVIYGYSPDALYGVEASAIEEIGTFYERNDAAKLREIALSRIHKPLTNTQPK
jgi:hypothetical protein